MDRPPRTASTGGDDTRPAATRNYSNASTQTEIPSPPPPPVPSGSKRKSSTSPRSSKNPTSPRRPPPPYAEASGSGDSGISAGESSDVPTGSHPPIQPITQQEEDDAFAQAETTIEPRTDDSDMDSAYESDSAGSTTTSITSSVMHFPFENGRRYHKFREGRYLFPNDEDEQDREDMKHACFAILLGQLHLAPIGSFPHRILDVGTGTGIWAIEMGENYPSATVIGADLSPIQPNSVPPNVQFIVDDVESEWIYPPDHFSYVHGRHIVQAIRNWPQLLTRALEHLEPGGWMEMQEVLHYPLFSDPPQASSNNPLAQYWQNVIDGLARMGVDLAGTPKLASKMREAGFTNVTERIFHVPIGGWPKNRVLRQVGIYWREVLLKGLQAIALGPLTRGLGWSWQEVEVFLVNVRQAYMDPHIHAYMPFHVICGQKPMA